VGAVWRSLREEILRIDRCDSLPMVPLSAHSEALSHWARWATKLPFGEAQEGAPGTTDFPGTDDWDALRRLVSAHALMAAKTSVSPHQWLAASDLIQNCIAMSQAEGARLAQLYRDSKLRLFPLSDPLNVLFPFTAVQDRHKSDDPCCKRGLCVPGTGVLRLRSAAVS
jgi:hypothetical protein